MERTSLIDRMTPWGADDFQTPPHAIRPLLKYLRNGSTVWEPACGYGNLVSEMNENGHKVISTDILMGVDFLTYDKISQDSYDYIVTNPPFSLKDKFIKRCYDLGKPWALLLPITAIGGVGRQNMYRNRGGGSN